jgi:hypothetical protein
MSSRTRFVNNYSIVPSLFLFPLSFTPLSLLCFFFSLHFYLYLPLLLLLSLYLLFASRRLFLLILVLFHSLNAFIASFFNCSHSLFHHQFSFLVLFTPLTIMYFLSCLCFLNYFFQFSISYSPLLVLQIWLFLVPSYSLHSLVIPYFYCHLLLLPLCSSFSLFFYQEMVELYSCPCFTIP